MLNMTGGQSLRFSSPNRSIILRHNVRSEHPQYECPCSMVVASSLVGSREIFQPAPLRARVPGEGTGTM